MFIYEKNNKLNVVVDATNQMPVENPDIVIDKEEAVKILVDGTDIAGGSNSSTEETVEPKEPAEEPGE